MIKLAADIRIEKYRIIRKLGEGGMGEVFEAINDDLGRHVAIKVLHANYDKDPQVVGRFFNEARAANQVDHPGMVQVHEFAQLPDGTAYIVMEYLRGESLAARYRRGKLQYQDVARLGYLVADALAAAHARGIVHRDLKPDNIMIVSDPNVPGNERTKILDFGIAKLSEGSALEKTRTAAVMGTPHFMSPEQCRGAGSVDDRADVYALGVILFIGIAGRPPFDGEGIGEIIAKHIYEAPPPLSVLAPNAPIALLSIVERLLQKDRTLRPSMREVATTLQAIAKLDSINIHVAGTNSSQIRVYPAESPSQPAGPASTLGAGRGQSFKSPSRVSWRRTGALAGCTVLGVGLLFAVQLTRRPASGSMVTKVASGTLAPDRLIPAQRFPAPDEGAVAKVTVQPDEETAVAKDDSPSPSMNHGGSPASAHRDRKSRSAASSPLVAAAPPVTPGAGTPPAAPVGPAENSPEELLRQADAAFASGQFAQAVKLARLGKPADPERSWRLIGIAACMLGDLRLSAEAHRLTSAAGKDAISQTCSAHSAMMANPSRATASAAKSPLAASAPDTGLRPFPERSRSQALTLTSASASAPAALRDAWSQFETGNYKRAIELALAAKDVPPQHAWLLAGVAACHLSAKDMAGRAFQKVPLSGQLLMSTVCRQHEVPLDF